MGEQFVSILDLISSSQIRVPIHKETTVEEAIIYVCRKLEIKPGTRHLFGLKFDNNQWASLNVRLSEFKYNSFELRIRFKFQDSLRIHEIDKHAFNYYFFQVKNDLISNKIEEGSYEKHKEDLLGLSVVDMYRVMVETGVSKEDIILEYKKYIPKEAISFHKFFLKKPIKNELSKLEMSNMASSELKKIYLQRFEDMVPGYKSETYKAKMDVGGTEKKIILLIYPFHNEMPGVQYQFVGQDVWNYMCSFEDLCCISLHSDGRAEISRKNGIPIYLRMNYYSLASFISLLDGYYRLSIKWSFNLCTDFITPSLQFLQSIKCHGPVGQSFALKKLEEKRKNKPGCFILRESEEKYDSYIIDVCNSHKKAISYQIEHRGEGHYWFSADKESYPTIQALICRYRSYDSKIPMLECIPPSEYDISSLLLCRFVTNVVKDPQEVSEKAAPQIINMRHLHMYSGAVYEGQWGLTQMRKYIWKNKTVRMDVAVKSLKPNYRDFLQDFLDLIDTWSLIRSSCVVRLLGVSLSKVCMVTEFFPLGPLDVYLQQNKSRLEEVDLVEAATYIASAIWHLETEGIVHGYLRCRKVLVSTHTDNSFIVKVSDPGLHTTFPENDWHWIPPELYDSPSDAFKYTTADVWALGTTLWELFSYGIHPFVHLLSIKDYYRQGERLPKPNKCSREIYSLMRECWHPDPDQRKRPQAAMRDINQILYQVHNARRKHSYATAKPMKGSSSVETLVDVSSIALDDHSEISSQCTTMSTVDIDSGPIDLDSSCSFNLNTTDQRMKSISGFFGRQFSEDTTSICSNSSFQSIMHNEFKIVIQGSIGKGCYGEVYKGCMEYPDDSDVQYVAVKKLITNKASSMDDFEREIVIMKNLKHPNIVKMIDVISHPEISLIMEYVPLGSLKYYLKIHRDEITKSRLLTYSLNVAEGMEYLRKQKIVHRDLAARNVLVASENHVKISDFGLAREMDPNNYYMIKTPRELPLRWYAPESLRNGKFSYFSDVWSFGVLLYEMFTFGADPIIQNEASDQRSLLEILDTGARLPCPESFVDVYSRLMIPCWKMEEKKRPPFSEIIKIIHTLS